MPSQAAGSGYSKFRTGKLFFVGFSAFVASWLLWNLVPLFPHFDGGLSLLNVILSVEASIATSLLIMSGEGQAALQLKQLEYQLHLMEAVHAHITKTSAPAGGSAAPAGGSSGVETKGD